jgi:CelD/BcsL family acetyltransferase involved in cellulose biosynthesis
VHGTIDSGFRIELKRLDEIAAFANDVSELAARAAAPNVFYEPAFVAAAAPLFGPDALAGLVWHRAAPHRLIGVFPVTLERFRYGVPLSVLVGWTHPYAPLGTPLVDRDCSEAAIAAWLDHIAGERNLPKLLLMPYLPVEGAVADAFDAALARRGGRSQAFAAHQRALLAPQGDRAGYLDQAMAHKKRKELRRQRKRLAEAGELTSGVTSNAAGIPDTLTDFLSLEASGWKGRVGTAAANSEEIRRFIVAAVSALAAEDKASVARLALDGRAIAAAVTLRSGNTAWCWKIAYDEAFARASPGVQLLLDVTDTLLADTGIAYADSCATPDHPMIDHVWRERLALANRLMCIAPINAALFAEVCHLETWRRRAIRVAKRLRYLLRRTER